MRVNKKEYFCSWSGGKESALSLCRARQIGLPIRYLVTMVNSSGKMSRSHRIKPYMLTKQSMAIDIPLVQKKASWNTYEKEFKKVIKRLKEENIKGGVFGDIDIQEHRDWVEKICQSLNITAVLPLWRENRQKLLREFIGSGFKAIVVAVNAHSLNKDWLGRKINKQFMADIGKMKHIDSCGEKGEFHTFVYDGPVFKRPVEFVLGKKILHKGNWFLELKTI